MAKDNNINLVTTNFQPEDIFAEFDFSPDGKKVLKCAGGQIPATNSYNAKTEQCRITLDKEKCNRCPYKDQSRSFIKQRLPKYYRGKPPQELNNFGT
jgi:hypothetical protein